ncbi:phospholipase [Streptomyces sp. P38-E01]|uniref:Phospholipase n=1 Tax=Streptomyces tardus TaxID=2780544 RepID=A0A949JB05_9ACTN|nr:phospholipase [Streptomyces tardus]MBU7596753.1 phospholipase [Streptomyces tardus]
MRRTVMTGMAATGIALATVLGTATAANAAPADKPQVMSSFTQTSASSYNAWSAADGNRGAWSAYNFNWTTDLCSWSPDNPLGFPFNRSCARHDFGYRNYKAIGAFPANKARIDNAFHEDLKRVCNSYSGATKTACTSLAWTYYQAVKNLG